MKARKIREELFNASDASLPDVERRFNAVLADIQRIDHERSMTLEPRVSDPLPMDDTGNTRDGRHRFSILRAANRILSGRQLDGIEAETTQEYALRTGQLFDGNQFVVPHSLSLNTRAMTTDSGSAGKSVQTTVSPSLVDHLRNALVVRSLGATVLEDLYGNLAIPKQTAIAAGGWKAEGVAFDESNPVIDQIPMTPKRVGSFIEVTRQVIRQSSLSVEDMVRNDLVYAVAKSIDSAAIAGSGTGAEPSGLTTLLPVGNAQVVSLGTNGAALAWANVVDLMAKVDVQNALMGNLGYLTTPGVASKLLQTPKVAGQPVFILDDLTSTILGYPVARSNQVPSNLTKGTGTNLHAMIFGDWSSVYIGMWGGSIITVNPYSKDTSGIVRLTIENLVDIAFRHIESFGLIRDIVV
ncbi:phage major capsid protein [Tautonia rosea]|uniref:phage major capsid protein n=1 Tax=Tautonia rosea TaxID=2728037 RepID=UPI00147334C3|nr:phage major capsid protein [Tautonia rosea]